MIEYHWVLGFFLLRRSFPTFLHQLSVFNQVPQGGESLIVCCESNKKRLRSCAAWGKTGSLSSDLVKNCNLVI